MENNKISGTRVYNPRQTAYHVRESCEGESFSFFRGKRGCVIGKKLNNYDKVIKHFKAKGYVIENPSRLVKEKANEPQELTPSQIRDMKEEKKSRGSKLQED